MATMTAAQFYGKGDIRVEQVQRPVPGSGDVLVQVRCSGICGSDLRAFLKGSSTGAFPIPRILGHEFSGQVAEVGPGVTGFRRGDRVAAAPANSCGQCFNCQRGSPTLCLNALDFGTTQPGAHAEYVLIPAPLVAQGGLVASPDDISYEKASMLEPLGTCLHGLRTRGRLQKGEVVVIIGDGPIGLIQVMLARALGASMVICAGHHADRLECARRWGAHLAIDSHHQDLKEAVQGVTGGMGADLVVVSVPAAQPSQEALCLVRGGGRVVIFGGVPRGSTVPLDPNVIHYQEICLIGALNCTVQEYRECLGLAGHLPLDEVITHRVPLTRILDGYELLANRVALKAVVEIPDGISLPG
jgi:L-iditol 2-dehydrogenase